MELASGSVRAAPDIESAIDNSCIIGLGSVGERMLILLDIEKLMSSVEMGLVAVETALPPTPRPYERHDAWCLRACGVPCRACIKRCPAGAISDAGHDKQLCFNYIRTVAAPFVAREQMPGIPVNSCGLCQTGTPCEHGIPKRPRVRTESPSETPGAELRRAAVPVRTESPE